MRNDVISRLVASEHSPTNTQCLQHSPYPTKADCWPRALPFVYTRSDFSQNKTSVTSGPWNKIILNGFKHSHQATSTATAKANVFSSHIGVGSKKVENNPWKHLRYPQSMKNGLLTRWAENVRTYVEIRRLHWELRFSIPGVPCKNSKCKLSNTIPGG